MTPLQMAIKEHAANGIRNVAYSMTTDLGPVRAKRRKETLTGKYGKDSKFIYDLED